MCIRDLSKCLNITKAFEGNTCKSAMAGIKNLWVGAFEHNTEVLLNSENVVTSVKTEGTDVPFWKFTLPIDIGDAVEEASADPKLGTSFVELTINGTLLGLRKDYAQELTSMMRGKQIILAELYTKQSVPDGSGGEVEIPVYILYGMQNGVDMTGGGSRTGAESASLQGYELAWTGKERAYAPFVEGITLTSDPTNGDSVIVVAPPTNP
jgi:hypothetical protein